jgi:hypothetical protein
MRDSSSQSASMALAAQRDGGPARARVSPQGISVRDYYIVAWLCPHRGRTKCGIVRRGATAGKLSGDVSTGKSRGIEVRPGSHQVRRVSGAILRMGGVYGRIGRATEEGVVQFAAAAGMTRSSHVGEPISDEVSRTISVNPASFFFFCSSLSQLPTMALFRQ